MQTNKLTPIQMKCRVITCTVSKCLQHLHLCLPLTRHFKNRIQNIIDSGKLRVTIQKQYIESILNHQNKANLRIHVYHSIPRITRRPFWETLKCQSILCLQNSLHLWGLHIFARTQSQPSSTSLPFPLAF